MDQTIQNILSAARAYCICATSATYEAACLLYENLCSECERAENLCRDYPKDAACYDCWYWTQYYRGQVEAKIIDLEDAEAKKTACLEALAEV